MTLGKGRTGPFVLLLALLLTSAPLAAAADDPFLRRTATVEAVERVGPAVVNITTERLVAQRNPFQGFFPDPTFESFFRDFFEPRAPQQTQNLGSGVIVDREGHVLTNEHVTALADRIQVTLQDGRDFEAQVLGADPNNDIAVLRIETDEKLPFAAPGRSDDLMVGEPVIAIGNPFGLSNTVTTGVISALDRSIRSRDRAFHGFIQTDASINPGNSGGPLLNAQGQLIGINTAIYQGAEGIGFAIPIDVARRIVQELIAHGEVAPVWLGVDVQDLGPELRAAFELPRNVRGALVSRVRAGSAGARAGLVRGDVITKLEGRPVVAASDFHEMLRSATAGQDLRIEVLRKGAATRLTARAEALPEARVGELVEELLGLQLEPAERGGYRVTRVRRESGSAQIGIQPGDLLLRINGRALADEPTLRRAVLELLGRDRALLVVQRGPGRYQVAVPLV
jgi:serine protease Do